MSDDYELSEEDCPKCGNLMAHRACTECEDGFSHHDCGEDCCCCLHPEPNVVCDNCDGKGFEEWCRRCGWDNVFKHFLNGKPAIELPTSK